MTTPNIVNVATITPKVAVGAVTTSRADIVDVPAENCAKINTLMISNIDGTNAADITVEVSVDNGSNYVKIANTISVPADATLVVVGKDNVTLAFSEPELDTLISLEVPAIVAM